MKFARGLAGSIPCANKNRTYIALREFEFKNQILELRIRVTKLFRHIGEHTGNVQILN